jgi:ubiquinone/menaquinone biosynthesis C-methylase UbiE
MIALSKKRNAGENKVTFINGAIEQVELPGGFDVVITPFLLDNFTEQNLNKVFGSINMLLKNNGLWLNASFQLTGKWWQWILLKSMFVFFKLVCGIEASKLPGIALCFNDNGYKIVDEKLFFGDFVAAAVYSK